ncbi:MAG: response regulator [Anaerolineales bacterium]|nr:response regulator [Anaerolineales bacterium]
MEPQTILIVEDDRIFAKALAQALISGAEGQYRVELCSSDRQAIFHLAQDKIDLLIFSDNLPEDHRQSVFAQLAQRYPEMKTILLVDQHCADPNYLSKNRIQGCLSRPFDMLDFLLVVQQVLSPAVNPQTEKDTFSLLILEDDEGLRRIYSLALSKFESGVIDQAATMDEARSLLENKDYDILISDVRIGRDRATDILAEYRPRFNAHGTKIVMCSAFGQYRHLPAEVDHFLEKPISVDKLVRLVGELTGIQVNGNKR